MNKGVHARLEKLTETADLSEWEFTDSSSGLKAGKPEQHQTRPFECA